MIFFCEINFSRGVGGSLSYFVEIPEARGGYQFLTNIENPGKSGEGVLSEILSVVGYEYILEPHNLHKNMMHVQSCCFANINLLLFCRSRLRLHCHCLSSIMLSSKHTFGDWS